MIRVRYYSHLGLPTGYGKAALELAAALAQRSDVELELVQIPTTRMGWAGLSDPGLRHLTDRLRSTRGLPNAGCPFAREKPDIVLVHTMPQDCLRVLDDVTSPIGKAIAYTTYDGARLPQETVDELAAFNEIWIPTTEGPATWATWLAKPVRTLPHAYNGFRFPRSGWAESRTQSRFRFYFIGAWSPRKNVPGLIRAYASAFHRADDVELVLRTPAPQIQYVEALAATGLEQSEIPPVTLIDQEQTDEQIDAMHVSAGDCYVTASRGECWDLPCFDAALAGRHVITPHTGSYEYLKNTTATVLAGGVPQPAYFATRAESVLGGYRITADGQVGMTCRDRWREPSLHDLAERMRSAFTARRRTLSWHTDPFGLYSHEAVAQRAVDHMTNLLRKDP